MLFMKGKIYMNQKQIKAILYDENDVDYLCFEISEECKYPINLNSDESPKQLKEMFSKLLSELIDSDIEIIFEKSEEYSRRLYIDVCEEYVKDLNRELRSVSLKLRKDLGILDETKSEDDYLELKNEVDEEE